MTQLGLLLGHPPPRRSPAPPYLHQSPPPPSPSSSPLITVILAEDFLLQFAAQPVSPQMLLVGNDQIKVNILIWTASADTGCF